MATIDEIRRRWAGIVGGTHDYAATDIATLLAALDEARATARREALEEAAAECERARSRWSDLAEYTYKGCHFTASSVWSNRAEGAGQCRDAIRALAAREKGGGQ